jgi:N-acetylglucosaminyl-diphospho-decaprenol L-rhamnosyltransferase
LIEPGPLQGDPRTHSVTMDPDKPLVTMSIVSHGDALPLQASLASLGRYEEPSRLQILVTDNLGHDLTEVRSDGWHSLRLIRNALPEGYARNHNEAFKHAEGAYFCVLNPDVELLEPTLDRLIAILEAGSANVVAPLIEDTEGHVQDSFRDLPTPWEIVGRWLGRGPAQVETPTADLAYVDWIAGIFMLMHHRTYSALGGFDPAYRLYFEDVDLCTRARLMGFRIAVSTSLRVQHNPRRASRRPGRHLIWHVRSALRFFASHAYRQARIMPDYHA